MPVDLNNEVPKKITRVAIGCTACRVRHVRCDNQIPSCSACIKAGVECERALQVRFRDGLGSAPEYAFSNDQIWLRPRRNLVYRDETAQVAQIYGVDEEDEEMPWPDAPSELGIQTQDQAEIGFDESDHPVVDVPAYVSPSFPPSWNPMVSPEPNSPHLSPSGGSIRVTRHLRDSSSLGHSPNSQLLRSVMPFTEREAILIRNFTENMALWADATDLKRHFEIEVPRRSLYFPVLRYAVFAFSSRHLNRQSPDTSTEALEYYDKCLSLLIEAVSESSETVDEETLAAIAILRQYEEMEADDKELHLDGTSRIVNSMSMFDFNGGLGEAAAWLYLRQDIYISLTKQRPLRSNLQTFLQSDVFTRDDDAAYANKMVFLLAKALGCAFRSGEPCPDETLGSIRVEVDSWYDSKSPAFSPIFEAKRNRDAGRLLPDVWVLSPFHAVGLQYYHIAKIVLAMSTPIVASSVFEHIRQGKRVEQIVRSHLFQIIALSSSHARSENALFTARHSLSVWGGVFSEKDDQDMVLNFLEHVQIKTGWNTATLSSKLEEQWAQDKEE